MTSDWKLVLDEEAINVLMACRSLDRKTLFAAFAALKNDPYQTGDYTEKDDTGRSVYVKLFGRYLVTFWPDNFVKELRVVEIERVRGF